MRALEVVFLLAWFVLATSNEESDDDVHFTNSWAVHIENDDLEAVSDIAQKHGFVNQGQVGGLRRNDAINLSLIRRLEPLFVITGFVYERGLILRRFSNA